MNYQDKWGRFHHKYTDGIQPSSGNGWIYTAYAKKAGVPVDKDDLCACLVACMEINKELHHEWINRSPGKSTPPISRDEILGISSLGFRFGLTNWNFSPFPLPAFSLIKLVKQLWELRPYGIINVSLDDNKKQYRLLFHHRNYFWQNNLDQLYRFAFSVPVQDRHFILKCWDKFQWYNPAHVFYACVAKIDSLLPKKSGIKWLKYGGEENKKAMVQEFPTDHDIRIKLGL